MSVDFILVKAKNQPASLAELEEDASFLSDDYRRVAEALFGPVGWEAGVGIVGFDDLMFELTPRNAALSASCSGDGDIMGFLGGVADAAAEKGVVVIDVQTSELLDGSDTDPEHLRWYRKVRFRAT